MELIEKSTQESHMAMCLIQSCSFYGGASVHDPKSYSVGSFQGDGSEMRCGALKNLSANRIPSLSDPSNANGIMFGDLNSTLEEAQYLINFKSGYDYLVHSSGSVLSFEQGEQVSQNCYPNITDQNNNYPIWEDAMDHNYHCKQPINANYGSDSRLSKDQNCFKTLSNYGSINNIVKDNEVGDEGLGWLYPGGIATTDCLLQESSGQEGNFYKRPHMGVDTQANKKHCGGASRKPKPKSVPSKDPQSIAAKNRRERISERLKILQDLVPNGAKVDLVTMLEKAISYVKFLQLQVKVLATDEFWPAQGGKAPEVAQVKEAIDAILSSHRNKN